MSMAVATTGYVYAWGKKEKTNTTLWRTIWRRHDTTRTATWLAGALVQAARHHYWVLMGGYPGSEVVDLYLAIDHGMDIRAVHHHCRHIPRLTVLVRLILHGFWRSVLLPAEWAKMDSRTMTRYDENGPRKQQQHQAPYGRGGWGGGCHGGPLNSWHPCGQYHGPPPVF
jgi:hypothetical protein